MQQIEGMKLMEGNFEFQSKTNKLLKKKEISF